MSEWQQYRCLQHHARYLASAPLPSYLSHKNNSLLHPLPAIRPKANDQSRNTQGSSTLTSRASSMTYLSQTLTLPTNYTPRERHRTPSNLSAHQKAYHYGDLNPDDITQLTEILSHGPAPHLNRNGVIWTEYRERVTQLIDALPPRLRRPRLSSWLSPLCSLHRHMNHAPLEDMLNAIKFELEVRRLRVWQPVITKGLLAPELIQLFGMLGAISGLWLDEESFLERFGRLPKRKFEIQKDECAACSLARIGGSAEVAKGMGALILGAMKKDMASHRVEWCKEWIEHAVDDPEIELADMERLGASLRKVRKEWKAGGHVKGGDHDNDHGHDGGDGRSDYHEDDGLHQPPLSQMWPPRSDSQNQRYQNEPLPRPPPRPDIRLHENGSRTSLDLQQAFRPGPKVEPPRPPSTRRTHVESFTQRPHLTDKNFKGPASQSLTRPFSGDPESRSDSRNRLRTSSRKASEPSSSPPPTQEWTRSGSHSWNGSTHPLPPPRPRSESVSSHYSDSPTDNVPQPSGAQFIYQVEPPETATATMQRPPSVKLNQIRHAPLLVSNLHHPLAWHSISPGSPESNTGVFRGVYSSLQRPLYPPHLLQRWNAGEGSAVPVTTSTRIPIGYWTPSIPYLAVPDGFHGVDSRL